MTVTTDRPAAPDDAVEPRPGGAFRRRITELQGSTPRGTGQGRVLGWTVTAAAAGVGSLLAWGIGAVVVGSRGRRLVVPAAVALAGATGVAVAPDRTGMDDGATALVCTGASPEFCVPRERSFLLESVGPVVDEETADWAHYVDMPERVVAVHMGGSTWPPPEGVHEIRLDHLVESDGSIAAGSRQELESELTWALTQVPRGSECSVGIAADSDSVSGAVHGAALGWTYHRVDPDTAEELSTLGAELTS